MGFFKKSTRKAQVAEGGRDDGDADVDASAAAEDDEKEKKIKKKKKSKKKANSAKGEQEEDLELFGDDSEESDDDATIQRYADPTETGDEAAAAQAEESKHQKKVSVLLSKMSPEELFRKYDKDSSGKISSDEFLAMLPELGIYMTEAKAIRIFRRCDTDGGGEIDLDEFKSAMFAVDPVSGNTLGFSPSALLTPKDAFELFDTDGTGKIDEDEFADVLEYLGMDVDDETQEKMFKKYDSDKSGSIDFKEFRAMWLRLVNVRQELEKRGIEIPKYATPAKLQQMLSDVLDEEEAKELKVLAEAKRFLQSQRDRQKKKDLGRKAVIRAQDELGAALDAAGQVYIFGSGQLNQFAGEAVIRDEILFPGSLEVSEIWKSRVNPPTESELTDHKASQQAKNDDKAKSLTVSNQQKPSEQQQQEANNDKKPDDEASASVEKNNSTNEDQQEEEHEDTPQLQTKSSEKRRQFKIGRFVRRRPENLNWKFQSPPKLNKKTALLLKRHSPVHKPANGSGNWEPQQKNNVDVKEPKRTAVEPHDGKDADELESDKQTEELAKLFFENRELVRSLRFRSTQLMKNTGSLWGRSIVSGAISENVAFGLASNGCMYTWGGKNKTWQSTASKSIELDIEDDDDADDAKNKEEVQDKEKAGSAAQTKQLNQADDTHKDPVEDSVIVVTPSTETKQLNQESDKNEPLVSSGGVGEKSSESINGAATPLQDQLPTTTTEEPVAPGTPAEISKPRVVTNTLAPTNDPVDERITARSALQKMATPEQLVNVKDPELIKQEQQLIREAAQQQADEARYEKLKRVVQYYDQWELPPSNNTRMIFMEHVLLPKLDHEIMMESARLRGIQLERTTTMNLMLILGECCELEVELRGEKGHEEIKANEQLIRSLRLDKTIKPEQIKAAEQVFLKNWEEVQLLRIKRAEEREEERKQKIIDQIHRADEAYQASAAKRHVQMEDMVPEYTPRGTNVRIEISGITSRGPPIHSPRGGVAIAQVAAGGSHVAILLHNGSVHTWGTGGSGRLGHEKNELGLLNYDLNHPKRVEALQEYQIRQISCGYSHNAAVSTDGTLFAWGSASCGKLGVGIVENKYEQFMIIPMTIQLPGKRRVRSVSCGAAHTGAVTWAGELFMWGCANGGRLGLGEEVIDMVAAPTIIRDFQRKKMRVMQVSCGTTHSVACTEIVSELQGASKTLMGGEVYVCGGPVPLGRPMPTWQQVLKLKGTAIQQVSCGTAHTAAVTAYGELYTWGRNTNGCTGHPLEKRFLAEPLLVRSLHVEPYNLARGKPSRQISIYNEQGAHLAVDGDPDGHLAKCIHTHLEEKPWWEVDLGQPAVIERIRVWNRTDVPLDPSKRKDEYTSRLFPFWILVSEVAFKDLKGKEGLKAAKVQSSAFECFTEDKALTEWKLPTDQTMGQYIRIQLQKRNFLHLAQVEVYGVYSAFRYIGKVGSVHCTNAATMVILPPFTKQSTFDDYYIRAIQADADNATILRQFEAYKRSYEKYGRGGDETFKDGCLLCRFFRQCEICDLYQHGGLDKFRDAQGQLPLRLVGDRMGLKELIALLIDAEAEAAEEEERKMQMEQEEKDAKAKQLKLEEQRKRQHQMSTIIANVTGGMMARLGFGAKETSKRK